MRMEYNTGKALQANGGTVKLETTPAIENETMPKCVC